MDQESQSKVREALLPLGSTLPDSKKMFGTRDQVDPVRFLIGSAMAWGKSGEGSDLPQRHTGQERRDDRAQAHRQDVPVDGFWSISLYNAKGYFEANDQGGYSINNRDREAGCRWVGHRPVRRLRREGLQLPADHGRVELHVRLYRPREEILSGSGISRKPSRSDEGCERLPGFHCRNPATLGARTPADAQGGSRKVDVVPRLTASRHRL